MSCFFFFHLISFWNLYRQVKNKRANRKSLGCINPNRSERVPFLIPEVTAKVVEAAPLTTTEQPSNRVTRSQTKRAVETEQPLKRETKNSNKENESCAPQGFMYTAPKGNLSVRMILTSCSCLFIKSLFSFFFYRNSGERYTVSRFNSSTEYRIKSSFSNTKENICWCGKWIQH